MNYTFSVNSYCAIVAQARREKVRRDRETRNGRSKRAKTLTIGANYSTNGELEVRPLIVPFKRKTIMRRCPLRQSIFASR